MPYSGVWLELLRLSQIMATVAAAQAKSHILKKLHKVLSNLHRNNSFCGTDHSNFRSNVALVSLCNLPYMILNMDCI